MEENAKEKRRRGSLADARATGNDLESFISQTLTLTLILTLQVPISRVL